MGSTLGSGRCWRAKSEETSKLSREHAVAVLSPGLVAIAGGKYTTYRVMAADAIDAAAEYVPTRVAPSITEKVPLWAPTATSR